MTDAVAVLNAYGCNAAVCGKAGKNGVTVGFGKLGGKKLGTALPTGNKTGENTGNVTIDLDKNKKDGDLLVTIAHEGSHVADLQEYQGAFLGITNSGSAEYAASFYDGVLTQGGG